MKNTEIEINQNCKDNMKRGHKQASFYLCFIDFDLLTYQFFCNKTLIKKNI